MGKKKHTKSFFTQDSKYRPIIDSMGDAIHVVDRDLRIIFSNPAFGLWLRKLGINPGITGKFIFEAFPFLSEHVREEYRKVFDAKKIFISEERTTLLNGKELHTETRKIPIIEHGGVTKIVTVVRDISRRKLAEKEIGEFSDFKKLIVDLATHFINLTPEEFDGKIIDALRTIGEFCCVERSYIFCVTDDASCVSDTHEWCAAGVESHMGLQRIPIAKYPWFKKELTKPSVVYVPSLSDLPPEAAAEKEFLIAQKVHSTVLVPMVDKDTVIGFIGFDSLHSPKAWSKDAIALLKIVGEVFVNAFEHRRKAKELYESERFLEDIFSNIQDGLCILSPDFTIIQVNPAMEKWYAHAMPLVGKKCYLAYHGRTSPCDNCPSVKVLQTNKASRETVPKTGPGGARVGWIDLYSFPFVDAITKETKGVIEYVRDISVQKDAQEELQKLYKEVVKSNDRLKQLALRDQHTGLFNHRYLEEVIEAEFYRTKRYAQPLSVLMADIDYFKSVNDLYGHQFGDLVLKQFSRQLKRLVRRYDIVIRYGGEEFIVISPGTSRADALQLAQRIIDAVNLYNFGNNQSTVRIQLSIAVAAYPDDKVFHGMDLVKLNDKVLERVKESGGNRVCSSEDIKTRAAVTMEDTTDVKFLKEKIGKITKRANQSLSEAIFAFAKTLSLKDHDTGAHVEQTVRYAASIAEKLSLSREDTELVRQAAVLHDLGKIGISEKILLKKSELNTKEFETIKKHPQIAADILRPIQFLHPIIPYIQYHHERWDGNGYPTGLQGEEIPVGARIIALADVYQALISDRPYRKAFSRSGALKIIKQASGTQFDPSVVSAFLKIL